MAAKQIETPKFDSDPLKTWQLWTEMYRNHVIASKADTEEAAYKRALLISSMGIQALKYYKAAGSETTDTDEIIMKKIESHLKGELVECFERYNFYQRIQGEGESIDTFVAHLKELAATCSFCRCENNEEDKQIRDRLVCGVRDKKLTNKLLQQRNLTLKECIILCKAHEATEKQMSVIAGSAAPTENEINKVVQQRKRQPEARQKIRMRTKCWFCGGSHENKKEKCPAWGKDCTKCKKKNHSASVCKGRINMIEDDDSAEENVLSVTEGEINGVKQGDTKAPIWANMVVLGKRIRFQVDPGATVSVLPKKYARGATI